MQLKCSIQGIIKGEMNLLKAAHKEQRQWQYGTMLWQLSLELTHHPAHIMCGLKAHKENTIIVSTYLMSPGRGPNSGSMFLTLSG